MIFCVLLEIFSKLTNLLEVTNSLRLTTLEISFFNGVVIIRAYAGDAYIRDISANAGNIYINSTGVKDNYGKSVYTESCLY